MILSAEDLVSTDEFSDISEYVLQMKIDAIELLIRAYTHNNFQNRFVRFEASTDSSEPNVIYGASEFLAVGDTVQISRSFVNDGLYVVSEVGDGYTCVDAELYTAPINLVTKVEYPADVKLGALNLLRWEVQNRDKVGIKAETLSRHSVTYYDQDASNSVMGYPVALLGFLQPYMKARF